MVTGVLPFPPWSFDFIFVAHRVSIPAFELFELFMLFDLHEFHDIRYVLGIVLCSFAVFNRLSLSKSKRRQLYY